MGLLSFLATAALLLLGSSIAPIAPASAQYVPVNPLNAIDNSILGQSLYIYNPGTHSIISPVAGGNSLTMVNVNDYDNTTMQWTVSLYGFGPTYGISAVTPVAAGCDSSATAQMNAPKKSAVGVLCTPAVSVYTNFIFIPTATAYTYSIVPYANAAACVTILNGVPSSPGTACNRLGEYTQWQFVTI